MAINSFLSFFDKASGESVQKGKENWVEIQGWEWEVAAETTWMKGGGSNVGKPSPGRLSFQHIFDSSSTVILGYICSGKAFPKVEIQMMKTTGKANTETYFTITMEGVFVAKVSNSGNEQGMVVQNVELVFKTVKIDYKPQDSKTGALGAVKSFNWDIPSGTASPSA